MINQNKGKIQIEGSPNELMSEAGLLIHHIALEVEKRTGTDYNEIIDNILTATKLYKLVDSGMSTDEATEVLGISEKVTEVSYES